jgi:tetratricopeptide (TPR) repeat protein
MENLMRHLTSLFAAVSLVTLVGLSSASAQAESQDERARLHFEAGRSYYDEGRYERALEEFEHAYQLSQRPQLHYNLYLTTERLGRFAEAILHLESFLETNPPESTMLRARLENLRERQEARAAETAAETAARAESERRASEAEARLRAAEEREGAAATAADDSGPAIHTGALIGYAIGGAGLLSFAVTGGLVVAHDGDFTAGCLGAGTCTRSALDQQDRRALIADISLGVGVAGAVTGLVIHLVTRGGGDDDDADEAPAAAVTATVAPVITRDGYGLAVFGRF